ncbi:MAG: hypothetical protein H7138_18195, partial [Myxococcales bacterium]|nr:hypothetical protein [Myxococcales bacterium]
MIRLVPLSFAALTLSTACGDNAVVRPDAPPPLDGAPDSPLPDGGPDAESSPGIGLAVVNSDYASTAITLLDRTGQVTHADCINSGTRPPGNTLALSGDVVLPSQAQPDHLLVTIDRTNAALTWIDPSNCAPLRQLDVSTGFFANPHDVVGISPTKAYVTRYERNANPTPDPADRDDGDDLLIIDPSVPAITGRIDLGRYATTVTGASIQARPDRARLANGKLFVVLNNISDDFGTIGAGRVVVVDPATDQVTGTLDLPAGLQNCGGLSYVEATKTLVVACGGNYSQPSQVASSGLAFVDVAVSPPVVTRQLPATAFGGRPVAGFS